MSSENRQMRLGVFAMTAGHHVAAWRMPEAYRGDKLSEFTQIAKTAEAAKFDMFFVADSLSTRIANVEGAKRAAHNFSPTLFEPMTLISALAAVTTKLGFVATASTTFTEPYNLARLFASFDQLSGGRGAWNIVTTADLESARNFGLEKVLEHDERYVRAEEYVTVVRALWNSWTDKAIVRDREDGVFLDLNQKRFEGHAGKYLKVGGPLNVPRSPQGNPVLVQAGASGPGRDLAARFADVVFTAGATMEEAVTFYNDLKARAKSFGRSPNDVLIMPGISPIVDSTEAEAKAKLDRINAAVDIGVAVTNLQNFMPDIDLSAIPLDEPVPDVPVTQAQQSRQKLAWDAARRDGLTMRQLAQQFAGTRGHNTVIGTPEQIADAMEERFKGGGCDGYNVMPLLFPDIFNDFAEHVVPVLQKRGLFRKEYEGATLREHLGLSKPDLF